MPELHEPQAETLPRLHKVLAAAGVASRRASEELIEQGRVSVNGVVIRRQGSRVDATSDVIHIDGERLILDESLRYFVVNKPRGVLSTMSDDRGRRSLAELMPGNERVFHVGRLDAESEGLLLLTNDGELAHRLTHPSFGVTKTYICQVEGRATSRTVAELVSGVDLEDGRAVADKARVREVHGRSSMVEIVLHSGRKHIVRRMLAKVGHPVQRLVRTKFGPLRLHDMAPGAVRPLTRQEVGQLYRAAGL